jgi:hypothetical protein
MNNHATPLCKAACDQVDPLLYTELSALGVRNALDIAGFRQALGYAPCCSSVFLVGLRAGGSYDFLDHGGRHTVVHNGTLARVGDKAYCPVSDRYREAVLRISSAKVEESAPSGAAPPTPTPP